MKILYFDCAAGAAGDMILGALIDAGVPVHAVRASLDALSVPGWELEIAEVMRSGVRGVKATVRTSGTTQQRTKRDIDELLTAAALDEGTRTRALRTFEILGRAEAHVHGLDVDEVHFHEVGALDAIVDIVGSCAALEHLAPDRVFTSALPLGQGTTRSAHGPLPVPGPAVTEILKGARVVGGGEGETVTPTGAALLAANTDSFEDLPSIRLDAVGYGAGTRATEAPNLVRVLVGEGTDEGPEAALVAEANIDDMAPELFPHVIESLLTAGAHDAWVTPIVMKKGRPAFTLSALFTATERDRIMDVIYRETTTLGVRTYPGHKDTLAREWVEVDVEGHPLRVKLGRRAGEVVTAAPEYEDAVRVARATGLPLKEVYGRASEAARARRSF